MLSNPREAKYKHDQRQDDEKINVPVESHESHESQAPRLGRPAWQHLLRSSMLTRCSSNKMAQEPSSSSLVVTASHWTDLVSFICTNHNVRQPWISLFPSSAFLYITLLTSLDQSRLNQPHLLPSPPLIIFPAVCHGWAYSVLSKDKYSMFDMASI